MNTDYLANELQKYVLNTTEKESYIITLDGKQLKLLSGKTVWHKKQHASSALTNHLNSLLYYYREPLMQEDRANGLHNGYDRRWYERYTLHANNFQAMVDELKASGRLKIERIN